MKLKVKQLRIILSIKSFPINKKIRSKLLKKIPNRLLEHLERRIYIYKLIKEAEEAGLYEVAEHFTNKLNW